MAIKGYDGERLTPKEMAARAIMESVVGAMYQLERDDEMTARERALVEDQIVKLKERIEKMLGYEPGSWMFL